MRPRSSARGSRSPRSRTRLSSPRSWSSARNRRGTRRSQARVPRSQNRAPLQLRAWDCGPRRGAGAGSRDDLQRRRDGVRPCRSPASAPPTEFSSERAMHELAAIAAKPHPTGTAAAEAVRAYIVSRLEELGFEVEVQDTTFLEEAMATRYGLPVVAAHVRNVVARKRGTRSGPASCSWRTTTRASSRPGASDDGYGTAALLETARALSVVAAAASRRLDPRHRRRGAGAARREGVRRAEPRSRTTPRLVLNFEARGDRGAGRDVPDERGRGAARSSPRRSARRTSRRARCRRRSTGGCRTTPT